MKQVHDSWKTMIAILKKYPKVVSPFIIVVLAALSVLYLLYLAPRRPISALFAPPIRAFWGEEYLHYPLNLFKLPRMYYLVSFFLNATVGIVMTAVCVRMLGDVCRVSSVRFFSHFWYSCKKYVALLGIWIVTFLFTLGVGKIAGLITGVTSKNILPYLVQAGNVISYLLFIYVVPVLIVDNTSVVGAFKGGILFLKKHFVVSSLLVILPSLLYLPVIVLHRYTNVIVKHTVPEAILFIIAAGIVVSALVDILITLPCLTIFLKEKEACHV